jgi:CRP/FNR family transcriptional regulator, cyclic AMP receptor protein
MADTSDRSEGKVVAAKIDAVDVTPEINIQILEGRSQEKMCQEESARLRQLLRQVASLDELSNEAIAEIADGAGLQSYPAGTVLFNEGERHDRLYFVCSGMVQLNMTTTDRNRGWQTILSIGRDDVLAWSALIGDGVMTATAISTEDTTVIALGAPELKRKLEFNPLLGYQFMKAVAKALSRRLLATRLQLLDLYLD